MTLFRVDEGENSARIMWNYYRKTKLLAYSLGGSCGYSHGPIHLKVIEKIGEQGDPLGGGILTMMSSDVIIDCSEDNLSEEQKKDLFRNLSELVSVAGIDLHPGSLLGFGDDDSPYFLSELE